MNRVRKIAMILGLSGTLLVQAGCTDTSFLGGGNSAATMPQGPPTMMPQGQLRTDDLSPSQVKEASLAVADQLDQSGSVLDAITQFENVRRLDPGNLHAARRLAVLYDRQGQFDKAEVEYRKVFKSLPRDADLLNDWGWHYYQASDWKEAENKLRTALQLNGSLPRARCNLALAIGQQGRLEEAYRTFCESGLSPANAHGNIGVLYWMHGNAAGARSEFMTALQMEPNNRKIEMLLAEVQSSPGGPSTGGSQQSLADQRVRDDNSCRQAMIQDRGPETWRRIPIRPGVPGRFEWVVSSGCRLTRRGRRIMAARDAELLGASLPPRSWVDVGTDLEVCPYVRRHLKALA